MGRLCHYRADVRFVLLFIAAAAYCLIIAQSSWADIADLEKDLQASLEQSGKQVSLAARKLEAGLDASAEIARIRTLSENIRVTHLLLEERFRLREEKVKTLGSSALTRQKTMAEGYRRALTEYLSIIDGLPSDGSIPQSAIRMLQSLLDKLIPKKKRPIIGSLPYKHLNLPAVEPSTAPAITPAYKGGNKSVSTDDTAATPEAPISKEIAALAQSLNWNPVSIYEYVKNNVETEWYWGCMKGAEETLHQKSGNDCDQAALLVALLRASGYPTRYVRGVVEFFPDIERAKNITGIDDPAKIAEFFQKAGIPYKPIIAGGTIVNVRIEHIWVESQIPYSNYRGIVIDEHGKTWLGLDTSIKVKGYTYNNALDIFQLSGLTSQLSGIRDEHLGFVTAPTGSTPFELNQTPLEYLRFRINAELTAQNSQLTYNDFLQTRTILPENMKILPASLQFEQVKITNEYTAIPEELKHKVKLSAVSSQQLSNSSTLLEITLDVLRLSNQQVSLSYEPETVEDQETIDSYGGLDNTPGYLVRLRPVLKINGERIVVATDGLPMGADYTLTIDLISPSGTETINNTLIVGNLTVIGITAQKAAITPAPLAGEGGGEGARDAERIFYETANHYIDRWNIAEDEFASLLHLSITRPLPTVVTLGGVIDVTYLLDMPHGFTWKGVSVDADLRRIETVTRVQSTDAGQKLFMQLSSLQGSILENRIFEDDFKVESISTAKLIQIYQGSGSQLLTIDKTNIDSVLPTLPFDENIKEDIVNSVNQQNTIRIPQSEITYHDWTGTGYVKENSETGEAGWMLSGMIAGGSSTIKPSQWVDQEIASKLQSPFTQPNPDPLAAASIVIVSPTNYQETIVNTKATENLWVLVRDRKYLPVKGAVVTFEVQAGGGHLGNNGMSTSATATTDYRGVAVMSFTTGSSTYANPVMAKINSTDEHYTQVGDNFITAWVSAYSGKVTLDGSFEIYGLPDAPHHFRYMAGDGNSGLVNTAAGSLAVLVVDRYENPLSNKSVSLTVASAKAVDTSVNLPQPPQTYRSLRLYSRENCPKSPYIIFPDCESILKSSVTVTSEADGLAMAEAMFGDTLGTEYTVDISTAAFPQLQDKNPLSIHLYTTGKWKEGSYVPPYLQASIYELRGIYGGIIDGAKVDTDLVQPMKVQVILSRPSYTVEIANGVPYLRGTGIFTAEPVTNAVVTAATVTGSAIPTPVANAHDNGIYDFKIRMGSLPEKNIIEITGSADVKAPHINEQDQYEDLTVTLPIGTDICFKHSARSTDDRCDWGDQQTLRQSAQLPRKTFTSVLPEVAPPQILLVDDNGLLSQDATIKYSIKPADYTAGQAYLIIYENGDIFSYAQASVRDKGTLILTRGSKFDGKKTYEAELVLNYSSSDMEMKSGKVVLPIANLAVEEKDPEFPDVKLKWDDYYPALGSKTITLKSSSQTMNGQTVTCQVLEPTQETIDIINTTTTSTAVMIVPTCASANPQITNGKVKFNLSGAALAPMVNNDPATGINDIKLRFTVNQNTNVSGIEGIYHVKNNSNITFREVLNGEAVFVYDESADDNHIGKTDAGVTADDGKKIDYVQELLNQVVPRKRNLDDPTNPGTVYAYILMNEDGIYNAYTYNRLVDFKHNFNLNANDTVSSYAEGSNGIGTYGSDTTSPIFRKLMKDYGKRNAGNPWLSGWQSNDSWLHKVIDKNTLVGSVRRTPATGEPFNADTADAQINQTTGNTSNDTGLYELYKNVVEKFVNKMIERGEHYAGIRGAAGQDAPTDYWTSRTGQGPGLHGQFAGMSYSYGGIDSIAIFNNSVARLRGPAEGMAEALYRGNASALTNGVFDAATPVDNRRWAGMKAGRYEYNRWSNENTPPAPPDGYIETTAACDATFPQQVAEHSYYPAHWAGLDCSAFAQRVINESDPAVTTGLGYLPGVSTHVRALANSLADYRNGFNGFSCEIVNQTTGARLITIPRAWVGHYFQDADERTKYVEISSPENPAPQEQRVRALRQLRKGDLLQYPRAGGVSHMSIVYSDRAECTDSNNSASCTYEIVHAYGTDTYFDRSIAQNVFSRKVIRTLNDLPSRGGGILQPVGFGRIKLWD